MIVFPSSPRLPCLRALAAAACLLALAPAHAATGDSVFMVRDVPAKGSGETDREARSDAALNGAPAALERLLRRLTLARDREALPPVPADRARAMVRGIEVVRATRRAAAGARAFDGAFSYLFDRAAVGALLDAEQIPWSDRRSDPVLVLPIWYDRGSGTVLWDDPNPWRDAWRAPGREAGLVPLMLPEGGLEDLQAVDGEQAQAGDAERLAAIADRYDAREVLVAAASAEIEGRLTVAAALFNRRSGAFEALEPVEGTGETAMEGALAALVARLEERWKERVIAPAGPLADTRVVLRFRDLAAWVRMRGNLVAAPSVTRHRVVQFAAGEAVVALAHRGSVGDLARRLPSFGLSLREEAVAGRSAWVLSERAPEGGPDE